MKEDQTELNDLCAQALADNSDNILWVAKYGWLYRSCSIQPEGRPSISLSFHHGEFFEEIDKFVTKFLSIIEPKDSELDDENLYSHLV